MPEICPTLSPPARFPHNFAQKRGSSRKGRGNADAGQFVRGLDGEVTVHSSKKVRLLYPLVGISWIVGPSRIVLRYPSDSH